MLRCFVEAVEQERDEMPGHSSCSVEGVAVASCRWWPSCGCSFSTGIFCVGSSVASSLRADVKCNARRLSRPATCGGQGGFGE
jgi:hypothetical protein